MKRYIHPASADTSEGWNWIFGDLESFFTFFFVFRSKVNFPMDENRLSHNALTRRIDPHTAETPITSKFLHSAFHFLHFSAPSNSQPGQMQISSSLYLGKSKFRKIWDPSKRKRNALLYRKFQMLTLIHDTRTTFFNGMFGNLVRMSALGIH